MHQLHHYPEPVAALREMQRALVPGGQIVIFENAPDLSLYTRRWDLALRTFERGHVKSYASRELEAMRVAGGLVERRLLALRNEFRKHGKLFASIQLWSARKPSAS